MCAVHSRRPWRVPARACNTTLLTHRANARRPPCVINRTTLPRIRHGMAGRQRRDNKSLGARGANLARPFGPIQSRSSPGTCQVRPPERRMGAMKGHANYLAGCALFFFVSFFVWGGGGGERFNVLPPPPTINFTPPPPSRLFSALT